ncbi:MAG: 3-deoxy-D-manno-octulosonic acid transferase [Proteobacteria bacterium]|nr:3-deoxy-D-manno-octulosonic acid transferase [Pseudomonadota bacterium]MBU1708454.1 3-deoxy-D-manno-octulosonic acid transferase [Pseudomonadota bacterium]
MQERLLEVKPAAADLWIQAVSVGEAFLAWELVKNLDPEQPLRILITTNTNQGMEILDKISSEVIRNKPNLTLQTAYVPFDKPSLMAKALEAIRPKVMVLLESEIWPGLLQSCKKNNTKILIINGRMTAKSLKRYSIWPSFWKHLRPDLILAMSSDDAARFATLFGIDRVQTMHNIKFDRITDTQQTEDPDNPLTRLIPPDEKFIVLGSVRKEEEPDITKLICHIKQKNGRVIIGIFPRHMHRLESWKKILTDHSLPWLLRSQAQTEIAPGSIILMDTMGELSFGYKLAGAAFVGGSLAPLGGQNFLEPLTCGLQPVIGPHWSNFFWIGQEIIDQKLVDQQQDWLAVSEALLEKIDKPLWREETRKAIMNYVENRRGGSVQACKAIKDLLKD